MIKTRKQFYNNLHCKFGVRNMYTVLLYFEISRHNPLPVQQAVAVPANTFCGENNASIAYSSGHHHHWRDNPLSVLAFLKILFQSSLLLALAVHIRTPIVTASSVTLSSHLALGIPRNLFSPGLD